MEEAFSVSIDEPRDKGFDEETILLDESGFSDEKSFIHVPDPSPVGQRNVIRS